MGQGIAEVLTYAIGVAISPLSIIALILTLFSERALARRQWQSRPRQGREPETPGWMARIATLSPVQALVMGMALAVVLFGGASAKSQLDQLKGWLGLHGAAVMTTLFLVLGVDLVAKGLRPLTT